ncbi:MAG: hypothetical protein HYZ39_06765 [Mycolicibacterium cosmeticum]|nr:hypothetical protein [Mycolicibacterium cosmeticum]
MHADTAAIEHAGRVLAGSAADLSDLAAALPAVTDSAPALFGPIADALIAALRASVADTTRAVGQLGEHLSTAGSTAVHAAENYTDSERRVGQTLSTQGV